MKYNLSPSIKLNQLNTPQNNKTEKVIIRFNKQMHLPLIRNSNSLGKESDKKKNNNKWDTILSQTKTKLKIKNIKVLIDNSFNKSYYQISDKYEQIKINSKILFYKSQLTNMPEKSKDLNINDMDRTKDKKLIYQFNNNISNNTFKINPYLNSEKSYAKLNIFKQYKQRPRKINIIFHQINLKKANSTKMLRYQQEKLNQMKNDFKSTSANREGILNKIAFLVNNTESSLNNMKLDLNITSN